MQNAILKFLGSGNMPKSMLQMGILTSSFIRGQPDIAAWKKLYVETWILLHVRNVGTLRYL